MEDLEDSKRLTILERRERSIIKASALADTLPTEDFLEVKNLFEDLKKD